MRVDEQIYRKIKSQEVCQKFSLKNSKVRPPGNSKMRTGSAIVYKKFVCIFAFCFQRINICDWPPHEVENLV